LFIPQSAFTLNIFRCLCRNPSLSLYRIWYVPSRFGPSGALTPLTVLLSQPASQPEELCPPIFQPLPSRADGRPRFKVAPSRGKRLTTLRTQWVLRVVVMNAPASSSQTEPDEPTKGRAGMSTPHRHLRKCRVWTSVTLMGAQPPRDPLGKHPSVPTVGPSSGPSGQLTHGRASRSTASVGFVRPGRRPVMT
jgi:hypothetical protein